MNKNQIVIWLAELAVGVDMVETAENVWSDSCVCAITNKSLKTET